MEATAGKSHWERGQGSGARGQKGRAWVQMLLQALQGGLGAHRGRGGAPVPQHMKPLAGPIGEQQALGKDLLARRERGVWDEGDLKGRVSGT